MQRIPLLPSHRQPGLLRRTLLGPLQGRGCRIDPQHLSARTQPRRQQKGEITCTATEIQPALSGRGAQPGQQLTLPATMQTQAQQIVQAVVTGCHRVEQLLDGSGITRLHKGRPFRVITMTVARPTAAEHTMHPASISENSR